MHQRSVAQLSRSLREREFSSEELTRHLLQRIENFDASLNCFVTLVADQAIEQARAADHVLANEGHNAHALTGIPLAHKDIFCTQGVKTTCGSRMLDNFIAPYDATVVERLKNVGMVMLGKTNMDEFAMGSSNETSYYGPVSNPWDTTRVPGGSSGGSAAAVAARLVPYASCTDTGGSIRQPASLCGITGIKPTYGRVSRYGMIAFASSLDQAGVMANDAHDAALLMQAMAGFDERDSTSVDREVEDYVGMLNGDVKGLRIGVPKEHFGEGLEDGVAQRVREALAVFESMGAILVDVELPNTELSIPAYYVVAPAECSSNLSRFDGVRFGHRAENPKDLEDLYKRSRTEGFGPEVRRRIMIGTYVLSAGYYDAYYVKAQKLRRLISADYARAFEKVDVIMGPTTPDTAFKFGEKSSDPTTMYLCDIYTNGVNLAGLPGMSIPAGFHQDLPVGLHLVGNYFSEGLLLRMADAFQRNTDWHTKIPENFQ